MHEVVTGFFEPSSADIKAGIQSHNGRNDFGITTNIINGGLECGQTTMETSGAEHRADYYKKWADVFGVDLSEERGFGCSQMSQFFPLKSNGNQPDYFDKDWSNKNRCKVVSWMTQYSIYARDDYKRCVCDTYGRGKLDCPTNSTIFRPEKIESN